MEDGPEGKDTNLKKHSPKTRSKNGCLYKIEVFLWVATSITDLNDKNKLIIIINDHFKYNLSFIIIIKELFFYDTSTLRVLQHHSESAHIRS